MNRLEYLLTKLAEEAAEVSKDALKASQFGLNSDYMGSTNREKLHAELNDLLAVTKMLNTEYDFGYITDYDNMVPKINKVDKYWSYIKDS